MMNSIKRDYECTSCFRSCVLSVIINYASSLEIPQEDPPMECPWYQEYSYSLVGESVAEDIKWEGVLLEEEA